MREELKRLINKPKTEQEKFLEQKWLNEYTNGIYGGELIEIKDDIYRIKLRLYKEENEASLKFYKEQFTIYNLPRMNILDLFELFSKFLKQNNLNNLNLENKLWNMLYD